MPSPTAPEIISALGLKPRPVGGHYREPFRDPPQVEGRPASTAIGFSFDGFELAPGDRSPRGQTRR
jgi:predicted cupin superfamily sugar epimerase